MASSWDFHNIAVFSDRLIEFSAAIAQLAQFIGIRLYFFSKRWDLLEFSKQQQ